LATIFTVTPEAEKDVSQQVREVIKRMAERFRCGDKPEPGRSPMLGKLAFIEGEPAPAVLTALAGTLSGLFDYVCAKGSNDNYIVAAVCSDEGNLKIGDEIPVQEVHRHHDQDIWK
jgi:hypothetical protein